MKRILVVLTTNAQFAAVLPDEAANELMDQFYQLSMGEVDDHLFEMSIKNESGRLENLLIPIRSILYIQCREFIE
jgi:hypothetical protein